MRQHNIATLFENSVWTEVVFSNPRSKQSSTKITIRPVEVKQSLHYQVSEQKGTQVFHRNLIKEEALAFILDECMRHHKQGILHTPDHDYYLLTNRKGETTILKKPPTKSTKGHFTHNIAKNYLLHEGKALPFLVELGVMNAQGKVLPKRYDKFRQINRFLEMVRDILPTFEHQKNIRIVDVGCGKGYLTFAVYYYLHDVLGYHVEILGIDLKAEVMAQCQDIARRSNYTGLHFTVGNIHSFSPPFPVDMVIALHACDTATDAALAQAVKWNAKAILSAPCCQHELFSQVKSPSLEVLLRHGLLKERFAALATDAARAQLLETMGYQVQILEFVDPEHTPKNLMIRAVKKLTHPQQETARNNYEQFKAALQINPCLEKLIF